MLKAILLKTLFLATAFSISSHAMDKPNNGQPVRKEIEGLESAQNPAKKAKSDSDLQKELIIKNVHQGIYNLDLTAINSLLVSDSYKTLNQNEKSNLREIALQYFYQVNEFAQKGIELAANATDPDIKQRFDHQEEISAIKKICRILNVFLHLKNLRFPQALFSPKPYPNGPCMSLDKALDSLIMAEQQQISSCCFHLTLYNIAKVLVDKKKEGITIEIVTNQKQSDSNPILQPLQHLVANEVLVSSPRNNSYETNHHKFFIFKNNVLNKSLVWMGSYNPTGHSNANSWDDAMIIDDTEVIQDYIGRFNQLKSASKPITLQELQNIQSNPSEWALTQNNVPKELRK